MQYPSQVLQDRVRRRTSSETNETIDDTIRRQVRLYSGQPREVLDGRIAELEREYDMEQVLETNAGILSLSGAILGTTVHRGFFLLTCTVLGFLAQHATTGWCPPVPVFRRLGKRTRAEIDQERFALKALRGDFQYLRDAEAKTDIARVWEAVNS